MVSHPNYHTANPHGSFIDVGGLHKRTKAMLFIYSVRSPYHNQSLLSLWEKTGDGFNRVHQHHLFG